MWNVKTTPLRATLRLQKKSNNQPYDQELALTGQAKSNSSTPCLLHSLPDRPAKHSGEDCSANPENQKKPVKKSRHTSRHTTPATTIARIQRGRRSILNRQSSDFDDSDNYAVNITPTSRKSAKCNPPVRKKKRTIHMSDESKDNGNNRSNKTSKSKDLLRLLDSN